MSVVVASLQGRFGNQCMQYLFCRALAEQMGYELCVEPWIGEDVFDIPVNRRPMGITTRRLNVLELMSANIGGDIEIRDYCQMQRCMIYTKRQAQQWLKIKPDVLEACHSASRSYREPVTAHRRVGDYMSYGYVVVSKRSYVGACYRYGLDADRLSFMSEEYPFPHPGLPDALSFVPDFVALMEAYTLLRGNSTFSWLAALLGNGLVLSPVIEGKEGGKEHDCEFVAGNHPRFANLDFVEDLYVAP